MSDTSGKWGDLGTRILSAAILTVLAAAALWAGGTTWWVLVFSVWVVMLWELAPLCAPGLERWRRNALAATPVVVLLGLTLAGNSILVPALVLGGALPTFAGLVLLPKGRLTWLGYTLMMMMGLVFFIIGYGISPWLILSLAAIVVISDTLGYFAGRLLGGPKFWPRVSPKKTWSGTVAGWIGAALFGAFVLADVLHRDPAPLKFALIAVALSFAGQMGDIAESAIKRRAGVKDSSNLIPGHGGFLDRLDAMIAAAAAALILLTLV